VEFVNAQFEDALLPREQFQAVFSASAFHWVDPKVSWQKAARPRAILRACGAG
jgi:ubiquinone/menaquinone biosynthesis C-methylase UbiE